MSEHEEYDSTDEAYRAGYDAGIERCNEVIRGGIPGGDPIPPQKGYFAITRLSVDGEDGFTGVTVDELDEPRDSDAPYLIVASPDRLEYDEGSTELHIDVTREPETAGGMDFALGR